jgi:hypothetical protein
VNRQAHPDGAKRQARQVYQQHGAHQAAVVTGIPARTIRRWARLEQWPRTPATSQQPDQRLRLVSADAQPAPVKTASPGRPRLAMRLREELWAQLDQLRAYREGRRARDARDTAIVVGILTDKLLLLERPGDGSGGLVDPATAVARIGELIDVAEQRAAGDG